MFPCTLVGYGAILLVLEPYDMRVSLSLATPDLRDHESLDIVCVIYYIGTL